MNLWLLLLGIVANVLFAIACLPTAWRAVRDGQNPGVPVATCWLLFWALASYTSWQFLQFGFHVPFLVGPIELASWGTVLWFHYFPRRA